MRKLICLAALIALSACGPTHLAFTPPPPDKLVCAGEPGRPGVIGQPVTDEQAAGYMIDLRKSGQSCRDDVDWLRDWFASLAKANAKVKR